MTTTTLSWINEETNAVNAIWLDAVVGETFNRTADVTEFAIEGGATISDHVSPNQATVTLEVFISDTPVREPESNVAAGVTRGPDSKALELRPVLESGQLTEQVSPPSPIVGAPSVRLIRGNKEIATGGQPRRASVLQFTGRLERVANVFDVLNDLLENGTPCKVSMLVGTFEDLLITGIDAPRTSSSGSGLVFTIDFVQVRRVSSEIAGGTRKPRPKKKRNTPQSDAGNKQTQEASAAEDAKAKSIISSFSS